MDIPLRNLRNQGQVVTQQEAVENGLHMQLLDTLIARAALRSYFEKIGISASNAQVAERIRQLPPAINALTGTFDAGQYDRFLADYRFTRFEFENDVREDITAEMLVQAMTAGVRAPSSYGAAALAYESEMRVVSIAEAPMAAAGSIPPPTDAQLQVFYEENQEALRIPEFRALTLVYARPQDFIARVNVPEARVREEFESRGAAIREPERRTFVRLAAQNEAQARDAAARLGRGESIDAVAQALRLQAQRGENQTRDQVSDSRVATAVFAMSANAAPQAVRAELTPWAVVALESITPGRAPDFASVRDRMREEIALDEAGELLNAAIGAFEEARDGGASVAEAVRTSGLVAVNIPAVEARGRDREGRPVAEFADAADLVAVAFETPEGEASDFMPTGAGDVVVAVDRIIPSTVRPLAEVRDDLRGAWIMRERVTRLRAIGNDIAAAVAGGQSFAAAARANRASLVVSSRPLSREEAGQIPAREIAGMIFGAREGAVVSDLRADGQALYIATVEDIQRADPAEARERVEANRLQMERMLRAGLAEAVQQEIVSKADPQRNEELIRRTFRQGDAEEEQ